MLSFRRALVSAVKEIEAQFKIWRTLFIKHRVAMAVNLFLPLPKCRKILLNTELIKTYVRSTVAQERLSGLDFNRVVLDVAC